MDEWIDARTRVWAAAAVVAGIGLYLYLEHREEPELSFGELLLELTEIVPIVLTSVGVALLFRVSRRQREENLKVIRDLEMARVQGQRWRPHAPGFLSPLGGGLERQFRRWDLPAG